jgi:hypothetical protein
MHAAHSFCIVAAVSLHHAGRQLIAQAVADSGGARGDARFVSLCVRFVTRAATSPGAAEGRNRLVTLGLLNILRDFLQRVVDAPPALDLLPLEDVQRMSAVVGMRSDLVGSLQAAATEAVLSALTALLQRDGAELARRAPWLLTAAEAAFMQYCAGVQQPGSAGAVATAKARLGVAAACCAAASVQEGGVALLSRVLVALVSVLQAVASHPTADNEQTLNLLVDATLELLALPLGRETYTCAAAAVAEKDGQCVWDGTVMDACARRWLWLYQRHPTRGRCLPALRDRFAAIVGIQAGLGALLR